MRSRHPGALLRARRFVVSVRIRILRRRRPAKPSVRRLLLDLAPQIITLIGSIFRLVT